MSHKSNEWLKIRFVSIKVLTLLHLYLQERPILRLFIRHACLLLGDVGEDAQPLPVHQLFAEVVLLR